jgi:hypothetical protein
MGNAVKVGRNLDVVVDAHPTHAPFGKGIGLGGQRLEVRPIELFEQRAAGHTKPPRAAR